MLAATVTPAPPTPETFETRRDVRTLLTLRLQQASTPAQTADAVTAAAEDITSEAEARISRKVLMGTLIGATLSVISLGVQLILRRR